MTDPTPLYKMRTIAARSGLSPSLLRAWERRYGLLRPERTAGGHRLFTQDDLRVVQRIRALLGEGRRIGEVALLGREHLLATQQPSVARPPASVRGLRAAIVESALNVDSSACKEALDMAFSTASPRVAFAQVIVPALREIGELWAAGRCRISGEHLVSAQILGRLLKLVEACNPSPRSGSKLALSACLPEERHEIDALLAAYALAQFGYRVTYLGPSVPLEDFEETCAVLSPAAAYLSVSRPSVLRLQARALMRLGRRNPDIQFYLGGRGVGNGEADLQASGFVTIGPDSQLEDALAGAADDQRKLA